MQPETRKFLFDIRAAIVRVQGFIAGFDLDSYLVDELLMSAVERQLSIIGEAVGQIARLERDIAGQLTDYQQIISLRNRLVHAYMDVDHALIWEAITTRLEPLRLEVDRLLETPS